MGGVDTYRIHKMMAARVMTGHKRRIALVKYAAPATPAMGMVERAAMS